MAKIHFLTARMAVAFVRGIQGPDPARPRLVATPKHFAVHSGPELTRHKANVPVSLHDLEDSYLPAFRAAIVEGGAGSIMCAYNSVNGQPACANDLLLKQRLCEDWGFKGYVVSDCPAVFDIASGHKLVKTQPEALAVAMKAGLDNECALASMFGMDTTGPVAREAFKLGFISEADIDRALLRVFSALSARRRDQRLAQR